MKKAVLWIISLTLIVTFTSCKQSHPIETPHISISTQDSTPIAPTVDERILGIYELEGYSSTSANIRNPLKAKDIKYTDNKVAATKQLKLGNQMVNASYKETIRFELGDTEIEMYTHNGYQVGYRNDGQLYFVNNRENGLFKIELDEKDELQDIRAKLDVAAADWIDLTKYENFAGSEIESLSNPNKTLSYRYYNEVNGFSVDTAYVYMNAGGTVNVIETNQNPVTNTDILYSINSDYEKEILIAKLKDMYEPKGYTLVSDDYIVWIKEAFMYEGEIHILYYSLTTTIINSEGYEWSPDCYILVPISTLIPPATE